MICDFCGYLAQVKTRQVRDVEVLPTSFPGAAWRPLRDRMRAGIYIPIFFVLLSATNRESSIWYLPADLQGEGIFTGRPPLKESAKRAGWRGTKIDLHAVMDRVVRI